MLLCYKVLKIIKLDKFEYLKFQNSSLLVAENQKLGGNGMIELAGSVPP